MTDPTSPPFTRRTLLTTAAALALGLSACGADGGTDTDTDAVTDPAAPVTGGAGSGASGEPAVADVVTGLDTPWGLVPLAAGEALIGSRDTGEIRRLADGTTTLLSTVPDVAAVGEGGLLGLALSPDRRRLFAYLTSAEDNRIVAMDWDGERLGTPAVLLAGIPSGGIHNGGRLTVGADGLLYVGTGDAGDRERAQDRGSLGGKILRLDLDGRPAAGNPYDSAVWSYGHRNVQGLAFDEDGRLWASEFGASSFDEVNLIRRGANYGWPLEEGAGRDGAYVNPVAVWRTGDASPSGLAYWRGSLWMASLRGERLWEIPLSGETAAPPRAWLQGRYGRLRTVEVAPGGGSLWLGTSNTDGRGSPAAGDDRLLRFAPA